MRAKSDEKSFEAATQQEPNWIAKAHASLDHFSFCAIIETFQHELVERIGFSIDNYKYEHLDVSYDQQDIERHAKTLQDNPNLIGEQIDFIKQQVEALIEASKKYGSAKSVAAFENWYRAYREFLPALCIVFGLEMALEGKLRDFLTDDDFHTVAFSDETTAVEEQKSLLRLANVPQKSAAFTQGLKKHLDRFAWLGNKMTIYTPFTKENIMSRIEAVEGRAEAQLAEIIANRKKLEAGLAAVMTKLDSEQRKSVEKYREILFLRTARADAVGKATSLTRPLFAWMSKKLGCSHAELMRFSKDEIMGMLQARTRLDPKERERYHMIFLRGVLQTFWGSWGSATTQEMEEVQEIKGVIACKGYAKGKVKVIKGSLDLETFERGDILVAVYTNPNMVSAMEKAGAIVTNIGGLTSHAAIVSRELNKPCIIGTKIATQVLKDGDLVEVDANNGVARILEKKTDV